MVRRYIRTILQSTTIHTTFHTIIIERKTTVTPNDNKNLQIDASRLPPRLDTSAGKIPRIQSKTIVRIWSWTDS